jgi:hypothetical protein
MQPMIKSLFSSSRQVLSAKLRQILVDIELWDGRFATEYSSNESDHDNQMSGNW